MKVSALIGLCVAAGAAGVIVLSQVGLEETSSPPAQATTAYPVETRSDRVDPAIDAVVESPGADDGRVEPATTDAAIVNPLVERQQAMANAMYQTIGSRVAERLTDSGLATSDSEELARNYTTGLAACATNSLTMEAGRQSVSIEEMISRLRAAMDFGDVNLSDVSMTDMIDRLSTVVDLASMETNLFPCLTGATERAGLSFQSETEALSDQLGLKP